MKQTPCEYMKWNGLPTIRREFAESMINEFGLTQKETAEKLNLTPAAICQYIGKKRGKTEILDNELLKEIKISANNIINNGEKSIISETCRICSLMREKDLLLNFCDNCKKDLK